jgi:hypothetical protein
VVSGGIGIGRGGGGAQLDLELGKREGGALGDVFVYEKDDGGVSASFETVELVDAVGRLGTGQVIWAEEEEAEEVRASGEGAGGAEGDVVGSEGCFWGWLVGYGGLVDGHGSLWIRYLSIAMDLATEGAESLLGPKWHCASESSRTSSSRC